MLRYLRGASLRWNTASHHEGTELFQGDGENGAKSISLSLLPFLGVYCLYQAASTEMTNQACSVFRFFFSLPNQSTWCGKKASMPGLGFVSSLAHLQGQNDWAPIKKLTFGIISMLIKPKLISTNVPICSVHENQNFLKAAGQTATIIKVMIFTEKDRQFWRRELFTIINKIHSKTQSDVFISNEFR